MKSDKNEHELKVLSTIPDNIEGRGNRVRLQEDLVLVKLDGKTVRRDNELPLILRKVSGDPDAGPLKKGDDKEEVQCTLELEFAGGVNLRELLTPQILIRAGTCKFQPSALECVLPEGCWDTELFELLNRRPEQPSSFGEVGCMLAICAARKKAKAEMEMGAPGAAQAHPASAGGSSKEKKGTQVLTNPLVNTAQDGERCVI